MPDIDIDDKNADTARASSEIDLYHEGVSPTVDDPFLSENNLGLGYYTNSEYWQQVQSFADGLFGDAAFSRLISERAIEETKHKLATEGWSYYTEKREVEFKSWDEKDDPEDVVRRRKTIRERGDEIWDQLNDQRKLEALSDKVGGGSWTPTQWRMLMMRHEAGRSRGARTLDNLFSRVQVNKVDDDVADSLESDL